MELYCDPTCWLMTLLRLFITTTSLYLLVAMSFSVESFVDSPKLFALMSLKKAELATLAQHYKLEVPSTMKKSDIRKMLVDYLVDEEIVSEDEAESDTSAVELKRLELRERKGMGDSAKIKGN